MYSPFIKKSYLQVAFLVVATVIRITNPVDGNHFLPEYKCAISFYERRVNLK
jgi:hypothetical protein